MFKHISANELKEKLKNKEDILILDVRQPYEHDEFNLPNSVLIPLNELPERIGELNSFKEKEIVIYCKAGVRSQMACQVLAANGFKNLVNIKDGILGW